MDGANEYIKERKYLWRLKNRRIADEEYNKKLITNIFFFLGLIIGIPGLISFLSYYYIIPCKASKITIDYGVTEFDVKLSFSYLT